jgi:hypothetical protein
MYQTINAVSNFRDEFRACGRVDQFSYEGLGILYAYFEEYENDTGESVELDVIAICCDFSEDSYENIAAQYGVELDEDEDYQKQQVIDYLQDQGAYVGDSINGIIYRNF